MSKLQEVQEELKMSWSQWMAQFKKAHWFIKIIAIILLCTLPATFITIIIYNIIIGIGKWIIRMVKKFFKWL